MLCFNMGGSFTTAVVTIWGAKHEADDHPSKATGAFRERQAPRLA